MCIILILIVCAVLSYILYRHVEKKYYLFELEACLGCVCIICVISTCLCIPWCVIARNPSINDIERSKVEAQREAIVSALKMEDRDLYVLARDVGEFNAKVRSLKKMRENPMLKDYIWHFYDNIEEIRLEEYKKEA